MNDFVGMMGIMPTGYYQSGRTPRKYVPHKKRKPTNPILEPIAIVSPPRQFVDSGARYEDMDWDYPKATPKKTKTNGIKYDIIPKVHPVVDIMVQCAQELIDQRDADGFMAMYWLIRWVEKSPVKWCDNHNEPALPTIPNFRKYFDKSLDLASTIPQSHSVLALKKVYTMTESRIPKNSRIWRGLYDNKK